MPHIRKEIRITPYDQQPINIQERDLQGINYLILCEEGTPNGTPKLHYHGYIDANICLSKLRILIYKWAHAEQALIDKKVNGNSIYFTRDPHEHTFGYITKNKVVSFNHGYSQSQITEFFKQSAEYTRQKETNRRRDNRTRKMELQDVIEEVQKDLETKIISAEYHEAIAVTVIKHILAICSEKGVRFPTRSQMEYYVIDLLYKNGFKQSAIDYYEKSFRINR